MGGGLISVCNKSYPINLFKSKNYSTVGLGGVQGGTHKEKGMGMGAIYHMA